MTGFDGQKALAFLLAASIWAVGTASAQSHFAKGEPKAVQNASVGADRRALELPVGDVKATPAQHLAEAVPSPSELRTRLLYRGCEFSTFQNSSRDAMRRGETPVLKRSFDPQIEDRWLAWDKVQHVTFSFLWTLGTQYVVVNKGRISEHHALPVSISSSALVGVSKEYYDLKIGPTNYFSPKDLAADAFGILLATGVILL